MTVHNLANSIFNFEIFTSKDIQINTSSSIRTAVRSSPSVESNIDDKNIFLINDNTLTNVAFNRSDINALETILTDGTYNSFTAPTNFSFSGFDWFERLITKEQNVNIGSFSEKTIIVSVYSSYRSDTIQLNSISNNTGQGSEIVFPESLPFQHKPQSVIEFDVLFSAEGSSTVNGDIILNYEFETSSVNIKGQRIFIFPWIPEDGVEEILEWKTNIMPSTNKESRIALRSAPLSKRKYSFILEDYERINFESDIGNRQIFYTAPSWWDARYIKSLSQGQTVIDSDFSFSEFLVGILCLVVNPNDLSFEARQIESITDNQMTLTDGLNLNYKVAFLVPCFVGSITSSSISVLNNNLYIADIEISCSDFVNRNINNYNKLDGIDILDKRSISNSNITSVVTRKGKDVSNQISSSKFFALENRYRNQERFEWLENGIENRSDLKNWLYSRFGRQKKFIYSTWQNDFKLDEDFTSGSNSIDIKPTKLTPDFYIQLEFNDGSIHHAKCTNKIINSNYETLVFEPVHAGFLASDVKTISKMRVMRNSSDSIKIKYSNHQKTNAAINFVEI